MLVPHGDTYCLHTRRPQRIRRPQHFPGPHRRRKCSTIFAAYSGCGGTGISGGHAVTTYGYATAAKQWNVSVYDPYDGVRHTGVASGTMYGAGFNNHELVW